MPRVPMSTGGNSAISFVSLASRVMDLLCMLSLVGAEEVAKSSVLRTATSGFVLVGKMQILCGIFFFILCSISEMHGIKFV